MSHFCAFQYLGEGGASLKAAANQNELFLTGHMWAHWNFVTEPMWEHQNAMGL